jgi:hypothetical protein
LSEELTKLDLTIALTRQEKQLGEIVKQANAALDAWQGKSLENSPTIAEVHLKIRMLTLRDQREPLWNELCQAGCSILRKDRASVA